MKRVVERIMVVVRGIRVLCGTENLVSHSFLLPQGSTRRPVNKLCGLRASFLSRVSAAVPPGPPARWWRIPPRPRRPLKVRALPCPASERAVESIRARRAQHCTARLAHALLQSTWASTQTLTTFSPLFVSQFRAVSAPKNSTKKYGALHAPTRTRPIRRACMPLSSLTT